ncbi:hypothetical protein BaRGS_00019319 [Batillaria attramentaria]|uniref:Uncharacterized protein n=1 Tax=Batillaria attramentaria TaxID=370345 RepID=A0ABD0KQ28_9CAEN
MPPLHPPEDCAPNHEFITLSRWYLTPTGIERRDFTPIILTGAAPKHDGHSSRDVPTVITEVFTSTGFSLDPRKKRKRDCGVIDAIVQFLLRAEAANVFAQVLSRASASLMIAERDCQWGVEAPVGCREQPSFKE